MPSRRPFLFLLAGSVLVHAAAIAWVQVRTGRIDAYAFNSLDCGEYYSIARNILHNGTFSQSKEAPFAPDTWRTPGYPMFLAAGMFVVGDSPTGLIILQQIAAILSVLIFFNVTSRHMSAGRAAIVSALFLIEPYHLFYSFWLLSTTFFTLVLLLNWWTWERACKSASIWHFTAVGILSGFLVLIWPGAILIPCFVLGGLVFHQLRHIQISKSSNRTILIMSTAVACVVPPAAWMARNMYVAGHFALSDQSGIVLAYFKATEVELWRKGRTEDRYIETSLDPARRSDPHVVWEEIDAELKSRVRFKCGEIGNENANADPCKVSELTWQNLAQGNKTSHDSFALSQLLTTIGSSMLMKSPSNTIACGVIRTFENLAFPLALAIEPARNAPVNRWKAVLLGVAYTILGLTAFVGVIRRLQTGAGTVFPHDMYRRISAYDDAAD